MDAISHLNCSEVEAVLYAETGQTEKARDAVAAIRAARPNYTLASARLPYKNEADRARFIDAWRKGGMPE